MSTTGRPPSSLCSCCISSCRKGGGTFRAPASPSTTSPTRAFFRPRNTRSPICRRIISTSTASSSTASINCLKAGIVFSRHHHHRQPSLRARNHHARNGLRAGRPVAQAPKFFVRHPQWRGLRGMEHDANPFLPHPYSARNLSGKNQNKLELQKELGLPPGPRHAALQQHHPPRRPKRRGHPIGRSRGNVERGHAIRPARQRLASSTNAPTAN